MTVDLKLMPDYVSFEHLYIEEGSCPPDDGKGIFKPWMGSLLYHGEDEGAGKPKKVQERNFAGGDFASTVLSIDSTAWGPGSFRYNIPNFWSVKNEDGTVGEKHPFCNTPCVFVFFANGDLSVTKYECSVTRGINNVSTVTGGQ